VLILAQFTIILFLSASLVSNYFNNIYYQNYVNSTFPILIPVLSIAFGATSGTIAIKLYLGVRKIRSLQEEVDSQGRRRGQSKRPKRFSPIASLTPAVEVPATVASAPRPPTLTPETKTVESPAVVSEKKEPSPRTS
jgi:hypothetical protein